MEGAANRLQKEAKGYLDSLRGRTSIGTPSRHFPGVSFANSTEKEEREGKRRDGKRREVDHCNSHDCLANANR